ncbi:MAG: DUF2157 domain-containing protein [Rhodospirillaceae bacterium]|nr:DUF2157 domain-containing protein [Rhodospirillaceae bacterium]
MHIEKSDLEWAASQGMIDGQQAETLWLALSEKTADRPRFSLVYILYFFGALVVIGAMGWFMTAAWEAFGGGGIFVISALYGAAFVGAGSRLWSRNGLKVPGGLLVTIGICMTPLAVYGLQRWLGIWAYDDPGEYKSFHRWIKGGWLIMEIATIGAGFLALRFFKFPFLTAPIAFALWYMSMDLTPIIFESTGFSWHERKLVSLWFGVVMIAGSYIFDHRTKEDYTFWGYLFGAIAFWGGLTLMKSDSEFSKFLYFLTNVSLMGLSVFLQRKIFVIFGAIGSFGYIGYLAFEVFTDSIFFPFILTIVGTMILTCGILLHRHGKKIEQRFISAMPEWMKELRPHVRNIP